MNNDDVIVTDDILTEEESIYHSLQSMEKEDVSSISGLLSVPQEAFSVLKDSGE